MAMNWIPVEGYEGLYEVSRDGVVRKTDGELIGQWKNSQGYMMVRLSGPRAQFLVHRLVAGAFIDNPQDFPVVNHLDHSRNNNSVGNLEWCTQADNLSHARLHGRMPNNHRIGHRPPHALLSDETAREIRNLYDDGGWSFRTLGVRYGLSKRAVGRLLARETYANV